MSLVAVQLGVASAQLMPMSHKMQVLSGSRSVNSASDNKLSFYRCPIDETLRFHKGTHNTKRFSIEAFKFLVNDTTVYMHCEVYLCQEGRYEKHCSKNCEGNQLPSRQKRAIKKGLLKESNFYNLDSGPITRKISYGMEFFLLDS